MCNAYEGHWKHADIMRIWQSPPLAPKSHTQIQTKQIAHANYETEQYSKDTGNTHWNPQNRTYEIQKSPMHGKNGN